jgi:hypothetical protein
MFGIPAVLDKKTEKLQGTFICTVAADDVPLGLDF